MPSSHVSLHYHLIFSTRDRIAYLEQEWRGRLHTHLGDIITNVGGAAEKIGGVDFHKGCYPGQEIVARAQYRGEVKRRMVRVPAPAGALPAPGAEFNGGVVVDSAPGELLAVLPA